MCRSDCKPDLLRYRRRTRYVRCVLPRDNLTRKRNMIQIRFADDASKRRALGFLAGRFSFKSWASGEMIVPEAALAALALEGIRFSVEGRATYEQLIPAVRSPVASAI